LRCTEFVVLLCRLLLLLLLLLLLVPVLVVVIVVLSAVRFTCCVPEITITYHALKRRPTILSRNESFRSIKRLCVKYQFLKLIIHLPSNKNNKIILSEGLEVTADKKKVRKELETI
jgi:hypothetical protein